VSGRLAAPFERLFKAFRNSCRGLRHAWRHETAFKQECWLLLLLLPLAFFLGENGVERALLAGFLLLVPMAELLNSAIEGAVDRIGTDPHPLSGLAKDLGSAGVFVAMLLAAMAWLLILLD